jgi:hypothetical protein
MELEKMHMHWLFALDIFLFMPMHWRMHIETRKERGFMGIIEHV